ncbi:MAG: hypothetical protein AB7S56_01245 [Halothiobacillaceae bacterium]
MNVNHTPSWGKGQLCLDIFSQGFVEPPRFTGASLRGRALRHKPTPKRVDVPSLHLDLFDSPAAIKTRRARTPRPPADPANLSALLEAFSKDAFFSRALAQDIFYIAACVAVSTRWKSEWPTLERWIESASIDEGGSGFWCEAAGLYPTDFLPAFWKEIEAQRAEPDQDERGVRAYGEDLGEIWPIYRRLTTNSEGLSLQ